MGIHHRRTVTHCRRERDWRAGVAAVFPFLLMVLSSAAGFAQERQEYREYHCTPDTQYECARGQCDKATDGFQHAESFTFNVKTNVLAACLWTNCYAAKATLFEHTASEGTGRITAIGKLEPAAHPGNKPIIVSLTIHTGGNSDITDITDKKPLNFTAVWGYGEKGLTLDMGKCALEKLP